jgi:hypothetical protein
MYILRRPQSEYLGFCGGELQLQTYILFCEFLCEVQQFCFPFSTACHVLLQLSITLSEPLNFALARYQLFLFASK